MPKFSVKIRETLRSPTTRCIFAGLVVAIGSYTAGNTMGYSSPAIPSINSDRSAKFKVSSEVQSWFSSAMYLSGMIGSLMNGLLMDVIGRKHGLMVVTVPLVIAWVIMANSVNLAMLFTARLITGACKLCVVGIMIVYNAEIATPNIRGVLVSFHETLYNYGMLTCYILGSAVSWRWVAIAFAAVAVLWTILLVFIPETPRYLLMKKKPEEARLSMVWLRGENADIDGELTEISKGIVKELELIPWPDYFRPPLLKPLVMNMINFLFQEFSAVNVIRMYSTTIFQSSGNSMNPYYQSIIVGLGMAGGATLASIIVERMERRTLAILSGLIMVLSLAALGVFFLVKQLHPDVALRYLFWLPVTAAVTDVIGYAIGFGPVPYIIVGELFSTQARGRASSIVLIFQSICGFLMTKFFVNIRDATGDYSAYFIYASINLVGTIYFAFTIPKTRGQSLEDIQTNVASATTTTAPSSNDSNGGPPPSSADNGINEDKSDQQDTRV